MSDTKKPEHSEASSSETQEKRIPYVLQITFWEQHGGPVRVFARDAEHAKELLPKLLPSAKDIVIHDIVEESALQKVENKEDKDEEETPPVATPAPMVH